MSANAPLTDEQRSAMTEMHDGSINNLLTSSPLGTAESVEQRARQPDPETLPADVTVRVEIAPPSPKPHPLLPSGMLKTPERVPVYFYALRSDCAESDADLTNTHVIFFVHAGANITGHPTYPPFVQLYAQLLRTIASQSRDVASAPKWVLIAPSYRLATVPENTFPAALQDLVAAYEYVLGKGYDASNVFVAGDSAGGDHAVVLTHLILQSNKPSPPGVIAVVPPSIQTREHLSELAKAHAGKHALDLSVSEWIRKTYVGDTGVSCMDPLVSCAFIPFAASWPRTLILSGTGDSLIDGCRELAKRLAASESPVELVEYNERPHEFLIMPHIFPETVQDALERIARFVLH